MSSDAAAMRAMGLPCSFVRAAQRSRRATQAVRGTVRGHNPLTLTRLRACVCAAQADGRLHVRGTRKRKGRASPHAPPRNDAHDCADDSDDDDEAQDEQKEAPVSKQAKRAANSAASAAPAAAAAGRASTAAAAGSHASAAASSSVAPAAACSDDDESDSDDAPEEVTTTRAATASATDGTIEANADSLSVAATLAAAAAAERQKKKNKKRGGKSAQAKRKRKRLAAEARQAEIAATGVAPMPIELAPVDPAADAELEDATDAVAVESSASPPAAPTPLADAAADPSASSADGGAALPQPKKKKNKPGLAQRTKLHAAMELAKLAALHQTEVKYYAQRYSLFSRFDSGIQMDREGWFSVTPELIAQHQAERCRADTIIDAYAGVGGNAIAFAQTCRHVIAIEIDPHRLALARHNAAVYGVADRIEFVCGDYLALLPGLKADAVFLAPPWGGVDYNANAKHFDIENEICIERNNKPDTADAGAAATPAAAASAGSSSSSTQRSGGGFEIYQRTRAITSNIAYCLPRNIRAAQVQQMSLLPARARDGSVLPPRDAPEAVACELEENRVGGKVKMMTVYFGALVRPPSDHEEGAEQGAAVAPVAAATMDPNFSYSETMAPAY